MRSEDDLREAMKAAGRAAPDPTEVMSRLQLQDAETGPQRWHRSTTAPVIAAAGLVVILLAVLIPTLSLQPEPAGPPPNGRPLLMGSGLVIDNGKGPKLCLGGVMESYPPQCDGVDLVGWRWPSTGTEQASETTWAETVVVGTWDGARFTVVKTLDTSEVEQSESPDRDLRSPCPPPAGGWQAPDPDRTTAANQTRVFALAERLPGYTEAWIDENGDPRQDPKNIVVNVRTAGDVAETRQALQEAWGGSLCVSKADHSRTDLQQIFDDISKTTEGYLAGGTTDRVNLVVIYDDGALQRRLDEQYWTDVVQVASVLKPYRG